MSRYNKQAARNEAQLEEMERLEKEGKCIFCIEHLHEDTEPLEIEVKDWVVKKNRYPYKQTKLHLVLIPKHHVKTVSELSKDEKESFLKVVALCEKKFGLTSYAIGLRSGDLRFNGGSIEHLHAHIIVGDTKSPNHKAVRFKMSSRPD